MIIKSLKVKAFRGFVKEAKFEFGPVTILFGPNGTGKSSTLNAIEWCLFGKDCIGKDTGIRERKGWKYENRNTKDHPSVEIELKDGGKLLRTKNKFTNSSSIEELLKKYSFKDFSTGVYQHQEVIRAILTDEPRVRNQGFDRLLGLSDYRNAIESLQKVMKEAMKKQSLLEDEISNITNEIKLKIKTWDKIINDRKEELKNIVKDENISPAGEKNFKQKILNKLEKLLIELSLEPSDELKDLSIELDTKKFFDLVKRKIQRYRSEMPDLKKQGELHSKLAELDRLLRKYRDSKNSHREKKQKLDEFISNNGIKDELENRRLKLENELKDLEKKEKEVSLRGSIISKAIEFLEEENKNKDECPVCGKHTINLLEHLKKEYKEKYESELYELKQKIKSNQSEKENIEKLIKEFDKLQKDVFEAEKEIREKEQEISRVLDIQIKGDEDYEVILNQKIKETENEINRIKEIVEEKQKKIGEIEEDNSILYKINEILDLKNRRESARKIETSPEWKKLKEKAEEWKKLWDLLSNIISALQNVSQEEAKEKIESAGNKIKEYFLKITAHPAIKDIKLDVKPDVRGFNSYEIKDQDGEEIIPILSQGNLNALALAIFLALCENLPFGLIMLDDPSQSLSSKEKEGLSKVLNEISNFKQIIISTMDNELFEFLKNNITKQKKVYHFEKWEPMEGPQIKQNI